MGVCTASLFFAHDVGSNVRKYHGVLVGADRIGA